MFINKKFSFFSVILILSAITLILVTIFFIKQSAKPKISGLQNQSVKPAAGEVKEQTGPKTVKPIDSTDHVWGEGSAPVKMIVYSDFECPYCEQFASTTMRQIKDNFNGKVEAAFRHFPLPSHANAMHAAIASECASEQNKFWEMHDKIFALNRMSLLGVDQFKNDAADLGLDSEKFNKCLDEEKYKDKVLAQIKDGKDAGVFGTPTIFVNNIILPGAYPYEDFTASDGTPTKGMKSILEQELGKVKK